MEQLPLPAPVPRSTRHARGHTHKVPARPPLPNCTRVPQPSCPGPVTAWSCLTLLPDPTGSQASSTQAATPQAWGWARGWQGRSTARPSKSPAHAPAPLRLASLALERKTWSTQKVPPSHPSRLSPSAPLGAGRSCSKSPSRRRQVRARSRKGAGRAIHPARPHACTAFRARAPPPPPHPGSRPIRGRAHRNAGGRPCTPLPSPGAASTPRHSPSQARSPRAPPVRTRIPGATLVRFARLRSAGLSCAIVAAARQEGRVCVGSARRVRGGPDPAPDAGGTRARARAPSRG